MVNLNSVGKVFKNHIVSINPNSALDKCGIDLRLVINGLQKPLKRFVHRDVPHNQHYKVFQNLYCWITSN